MVFTTEDSFLVRSLWGRVLLLTFVCCALQWSPGHPSTAFGVVDARDVVKDGTVEFGFLTGYWQGNNLFKNQPSTNRSAVFFLPQWGVVLTDEFKAWLLSGNLEFYAEPLAAHFFEPFSASAFGGTLNIKYNFLSFGRWMPFWDGGAGMLWTDYAPRIPELSTPFEFILQTGVGTHFFLTDQLTLTMGARFSHISNSGLGDRNVGLNAWLFNVGFSFFVP